MKHYKTKSYSILLISLLLLSVAFIFLSSLKSVEATNVNEVSTVGTSTSLYGTATQSDRFSSTWYANYKYWAFYTQGTDFGWKTSSDGATWGSFTIYHSVPKWDCVAVWFDTVNLVVNLTRVDEGSNVWWNSGTLNSDGTISWNSEVVITNAAGVSHRPGVSQDSAGFPWVTWYDNSGAGSYYLNAIKANDKAGTSWGTVAHLWAVSNGAGSIKLVALPSQNMMAIKNSAPTAPIESRYYTSSTTTWASAVTATTTYSIYGPNYDAVADESGNVMLGLSNTAGNIILAKYWASNSSWGSEQTVATTSDIYITQPVLSYIGTDNYRVFYCSDDSTVKYIDWHSFSLGTATTISGSETVGSTAAILTSSYSVFQGTISLLWTSGSGTPWNVRFASFILSAQPDPSPTAQPTPSPTPAPGSAPVVSSVGTSTSLYGQATYMDRGSCAWKANGLYWSWYYDGTYWGWCTSLDGSTWSDFNVYCAIPRWDSVVVWLDSANNNVSLVRVDQVNSLFYCEGHLNSDGTVSWNTETTLSTGLGYAHRPNVAKDSAGIPWVEVYDYSSGGSYALKFYKATNVAGTAWNAPTTLWTVANGATSCKIIPLLNQNMMVICGQSPSTAYQSRYYTNATSTWAAAVTASTHTPTYYSNYDASSDGSGNVALSFAASTGTLYFVKYWGSNSSWGSEQVVASTSNPSQVQPSITFLGSDKYRIFYESSDSTVNYVDWQTFTVSATTIISTSEAMTNTGALFSASYAINEYSVCVEWTTGSVSPWTVRFASFDFTPATVNPTPVPTSTEYIVGANNLTLYLRSDSHIVNEVEASYLGDPNTASRYDYVTSTGSSANATLGFRVWLVTPYATTELTSGEPTGLIQLSTNTAGYASGYWNCPETTVLLGTPNAIQVNSYLSWDNGGSWSAAISSHISTPLVTTKFLTQTWQFIMDVNRTYSAPTTYFHLLYGSSDTANSRIDGIGTVEPTSNQVEGYRFFTGDIVGFVVGAYSSLGAGFYLLLLLIPTSTLWLRHKSTGGILIFFLSFAGAGGLVWYIVPPIAALPVTVICLIIATFLVLKVIR